MHWPKAKHFGNEQTTVLIDLSGFRAGDADANSDQSVRIAPILAPGIGILAEAEDIPAVAAVLTQAK